MKLLKFRRTIGALLATAALGGTTLVAAPAALAFFTPTIPVTVHSVCGSLTGNLWESQAGTQLQLRNATLRNTCAGGETYVVVHWRQGLWPLTFATTDVDGTAGPNGKVTSFPTNSSPISTPISIQITVCHHHAIGHGAFSAPLCTTVTPPGQ
jgi:hypothetical protein